MFGRWTSDFVAQFQEFVATRHANQNATSAEPQECEPEGAKSHTVGRSSDTAGPSGRAHRIQSPIAREPRARSPTVGRSDDVEPPKEHRQGRSRTPRRIPSGDSEHGSEPPSPEIEPLRQAPSRSQSRSHRKSPPPTSPSPSPSRSRSPNPRRRRSPSTHVPRSRSCSPTPARCKRRATCTQRSVSPQPGPSKHPRQRTPSPHSPVEPEDDPVEHDYDHCPTSYEKRPKKRGGCVKVEVDEKLVIQRTEIESLMDRRLKHKYVLHRLGLI